MAVPSHGFRGIAGAVAQYLRPWVPIASLSKASMNMVAEGVKSSPSVLDLTARYGVEMPITEQVVAVCHEGRAAGEALALLMSRSSKGELG